VQAAVEDTRVLGLERVYRNPDISDGTQWVLRVRQGEGDKVVYCDNKFPRTIEQFAERLDAILNEHGLAAVEWRKVPGRENRQHELELWHSIRR
jgi:hypothetical protein